MRSLPLHPRLVLASAAVTLGLLGTVRAATLTLHVQDAQGHPLSDAVVSAQAEGVPPKATTSATAQMGQKNRTFVPHVLAIQTGTSVNFPNFDTVRHHVYSFSAIKTFEIKLYAATPAAPVVFDKPGTAVLGCNIHDRMNAFIHVVSTPYFAMTDAAGNLTLPVPDGPLQLQVWHASYTDAVPPMQRHYTPAEGSSLSIVLPAPGTAP